MTDNRTPTSTHIALLRAVNVGGTNLVAMADLRVLAADIRHGHPRTFLRCGNLVAETCGQSGARTERQLEQAQSSQP